jgi:Uri superfamily endonuclease
LGEDLYFGTDMHPMQDKQKGTYLLILRLKRDRCIRVGKSGGHRFKAGVYGYVGSAFGPGGLHARLRHHLRIAENPRWHIDYLRKVAAIEQVWFSTEARRREHEWAALLQSMPDIVIAVEKFGATDCRCRSHLFYFVHRPSFVRFTNALDRDMTGNDPIRIGRIRLTKQFALGN